MIKLAIYSSLLLLSLNTLSRASFTPGTQPSGVAVTTNGRTSTDTAISAAALSRLVDGDWDPGTISVSSGCTTFFVETGKSDLWVNFDYGSQQTITTVYIMASAFTGETWPGTIVSLYVVSSAGVRQKCIDYVDGSGFYHCGYDGQHLQIYAQVASAKFTLCQVGIY